MGYKEKCIEILNKQNGIISASDLKKNNIPFTYITRMVKNKELEKVDRGIYVNEFGDYDQYYFLNQRYKNIIFSYDTALRLQFFTLDIPQVLEVTVQHGFNNHRLAKNIKVHYVSKEILELGVIEVETPYGNKVRCYNLERVVCDFIAHRKEMEAESFVRLINRYVRYEDKDFNKLAKYAKKMGILDKVTDIIEVLYE